MATASNHGCVTADRHLGQSRRPSHRPQSGVRISLDHHCRPAFHRPTIGGAPLIVQSVGSTLLSARSSPSIRLTHQRASLALCILYIKTHPRARSTTFDIPRTRAFTPLCYGPFRPLSLAWTLIHDKAASPRHKSHQRCSDSFRVANWTALFLTRCISHFFFAVQINLSDSISAFLRHLKFSSAFLFRLFIVPRPKIR